MLIKKEERGDENDLQHQSYVGTRAYFNLFCYTTTVLKDRGFS